MSARIDGQPGRCIHDMVAGTCAVCKGLDDLDLAEKDRRRSAAQHYPQDGTQHLARFAGICGSCDGPIREGDLITWRDFDQIWACPNCESEHYS